MLQPSKRKPNALIHSASPYLLQHAYNPVDWLPWSPDALLKAESESKLILVSIGYSACHWCHVMERECFEDIPTAEIMNTHFICIKVDREERPDIDQLYMSAVHLMGQRGGWPLNCIALPDGRPVYGGTYFPKNKWQKILLEIAKIYKENKGELLDYAERLANGIRQTELFKVSNDSNEITPKDFEDSIAAWKNEFDTKYGGPNHAPKFPLPSNYICLLRYGFIANDASVKNHVQLSLDKMAAGGIYDQIAGGFSRYSTDIWWKVPHFEKMLYDNAQLISLYAEASVAFNNERYAEVCKQTINWLHNELHNGQGGYYSALDADSEGIEGKFYLWTEDELKQLLDENELTLFRKWYYLNEDSFW
ncbi:MAG: thioredoxin domain-containing protein, partial [Bacteroidia bacterium]